MLLFNTYLFIQDYVEYIIKKPERRIKKRRKKNGGT